MKAFRFRLSLISSLRELPAIKISVLRHRIKAQFFIVCLHSSLTLDSTWQQCGGDLIDEICCAKVSCTNVRTSSFLYSQYGQRVPTAASPSNTNSSSSSNTGSQSGTLSTSLSNTNTNNTMGPSTTPQQTEQLSKTNLYIRGLQQGTTDKDLHNMCSQWVSNRPHRIVCHLSGLTSRLTLRCHLIS